MLAVLRNTLHMCVALTSLNRTLSSFSIYNIDDFIIVHIYSYGGIYERGPREYTLDDFYTLQLDKLDRYVCLKESDVVVPPEGEEVSSSGGDDDDDESGDDDREDKSGSGGETSSNHESEGESVAVARTKRKEKEVVKAVVEKEESPERVAEVKDVRNKEEEEAKEEGETGLQAEAFMGVAKDAARSPEEMISTPVPGETLAAFYARSRKWPILFSTLFSSFRRLLY